MSKDKSSDELASELRIRVVREVVVQVSQINILEQQASGLHSEINDFNKDKKAFLKTLLKEHADYLENGTPVSTPGTVEEKYKQYIVDAEKRNEKAKAELVKLNSDIAVLKMATEGVLDQIKRDVLAERYGRGELILRPEGLRRIVGRIMYLNESTDPVYGIIVGKSDKHEASITEIAWLCENSDQHPPLFFVDSNLMPLNEEELKKLCWENHDYKLLVKNIPEDQIVWNSGWVCCLDKSLSYETYVIPRINDCMYVVQIEKSTYPHWKAEVLGKAVRNKENLKALLGWGGYHKAPVELEDVPHEHNWNLNIMEWYIFKRYPGVILEMPQWEGERLSISGT